MIDTLLLERKETDKMDKKNMFSLEGKIALVTGGAHVNPIRSKTEQKTMWLPVTFLGRSLKPAGNSRIR